MGWPQITILILTAMSVGIALAKDGEPQRPHSFFGTLAGVVINISLLWAGGFFS